MHDVNCGNGSEHGGIDCHFTRQQPLYTFVLSCNPLAGSKRKGDT